MKELFAIHPSRNFFEANQKEWDVTDLFLWHTKNPIIEKNGIVGRLDYGDVLWLDNPETEPSTIFLEDFEPAFSIGRAEELIFMIKEKPLGDILIDTVKPVKGNYKAFNSTSSVNLNSSRGVKINASNAEPGDRFILQYLKAPESDAADGFWYPTLVESFKDLLAALTDQEIETVVAERHVARGHTRRQGGRLRCDPPRGC